MTPEQYQLVNRATAPWLTLWLLADFESARSYAVGTMAGGTYAFADGGRGQYETGGKGMTAWRTDRDQPEVSLTWAEIRAWALTAADREAATALRREGVHLSGAYPPAYPSIGRPYHWDTDAAHPIDGCEQCDQDRADLKAAQEKRSEKVREWCATKAEYDDRVKAFVATLTPVDEPDLLDLLGLA